MSDSLLTQADIDALIKQQPVKASTGPKPKSQSTADIQNSESTVQEIGRTVPISNESTDISDNTSANNNLDRCLEERILNIEQRLTHVEKVAGNLDKLEKSVSTDSQSSQVTPQQLQDVINRIQDLAKEVNSISSKLKGTLGYGAYQTFTCDKCNSHGNVATVLKCTQCGKESWRGWWPKK